MHQQDRQRRIEYATLASVTNRSTSDSGSNSVTTYPNAVGSRSPSLAFVPCSWRTTTTTTITTKTTTNRPNTSGLSLETAMPEDFSNWRVRLGRMIDATACSPLWIPWNFHPAAILHASNLTFQSKIGSAGDDLVAILDRTNVHLRPVCLDRNPWLGTWSSGDVCFETLSDIVLSRFLFGRPCLSRQSKSHSLWDLFWIRIRQPHDQSHLCQCQLISLFLILGFFCLLLFHFKARIVVAPIDSKGLGTASSSTSRDYQKYEDPEAGWNNFEKFLKRTVP